MVNAVGLAATRANLNIVGEAGLLMLVSAVNRKDEVTLRLPSSPRAKRGQSHYPARALGCFQESLGARIDPRRPSCARSFPALVLVP